MLTDINSGKSFEKTLRYITLREKAEIQENACQGVVLEDTEKETINKAYKLMDAVARSSQRVEKPSLHVSINPHPEDWDKVKDKIPELVEDITEAMGLERCQRLAVVHSDTEAPGYGTRHHIHVAYNSVPYKGDDRAIDATAIWKRTREQTLERLTEKYGLEHKPTIPDRRQPTTGQIRTLREQQSQYEEGERDRPPEQIVQMTTQDLIEQAVNNNKTLTKFLNYLQQHNCHTRITTRDNEILGISYENEGIKFKGSYLGRDSKACTLKGLANRGIDINLERDGEAIAERALDKNNPQRKINAEDIKSNSKNSKLFSKKIDKKFSELNEFNSKQTLSSDRDSKQLQI